MFSSVFVRGSLHLALRARLRRVALAAALVLSGATTPVLAQPAAARWSIAEIPTFGGSFSVGLDINNVGQVTGYANNMGGIRTAFRFQNGTITDLSVYLLGSDQAGAAINDAGTVTGSSFDSRPGFNLNRGFLVNDSASGLQGKGLGSLGGTGDTNLTSTAASGINNRGEIVGYSRTATNGVFKAFVYSSNSSSMFAFGGSVFSGESFAYDINDAGHITGSYAVNGLQRAYVYANGQVNVIPTPTSISSDGRSFGSAINNAGQVAGTLPSTAGGRRGFIYSNGVTTALDTLGGPNGDALAINSAGQIAGNSQTVGGRLRATLYTNGQVIDLNTLPGAVGSGWSLLSANGINDVGQLTGEGTNPSGQTRGFVLTMNSTVWESTSSGNWDGTAGWSSGVAPNRNTAVFIDPLGSLTVSGPALATTVRSLAIGGNATGNNGIATLKLSGGTITVVGDAGQFTTVSAKGVLTGDGTITGAVNNLGTVNAVNISLSGGLTNRGLVTGNGRLNTNLVNAAGATVRANAGQQLVLSGSTHSNSGRFDINGGELQVTGALANHSGGRILFNSGRLQANSGLTNNGQLLMTFGSTTLFGAITTHSGGKIIASGNSSNTFYDTIDMRSGGELRISTGSTAVFFGQVLQRTGSTFSGGGTKFYEGGLSIGASPGLGIDEGDVSFGAGSLYLVEIGGITACTAACADDTGLRDSSHDRYVVRGHLGLGGTLKLVSWDSFTAQAGQSFDLLDWGSVGGRFDSIDASGLAMANGTYLDVSRLYIDGSVSVQVVPEPGALVLMLVGLGFLGAAVQRRRRVKP